MEELNLHEKNSMSFLRIFSKTVRFEIEMNSLKKKIYDLDLVLDVDQLPIVQVFDHLPPYCTGF